MYYIRIGSRTGSPCNHCVHVLATGLLVSHRRVFFFKVWFGGKNQLFLHLYNGKRDCVNRYLIGLQDVIHNCFGRLTVTCEFFCNRSSVHEVFFFFQQIGRQFVDCIWI